MSQTEALPGRAGAVVRHGLFELRLLLRNGEQFLLTILIPVVLLIGLSRTSLVALTDDGASRIDVVAPGVIALAVMSTAFTSLAIGIGFDRRSGVLKFLGATPLQRSGLLWSRVVAIGATVLLQLAVLVPLGLFLGWRPVGSPLVAALVLLLGTTAFATVAVALAGTLRAEATLAVANGIYLLLLLGGGLVVPIAVMPDVLGGLAALLPSGALGEGLRLVFIEGAVPLPQLAVLAAWTAIGALVAVRTFRWE